VIGFVNLTQLDSCDAHFGVWMAGSLVATLAPRNVDHGHVPYSGNIHVSDLKIYIPAL
jgi:hypothetical protein